MGLVTANHWLVVASHSLAATAGARILEKGGNAVDAALATAAVIGVVEPWFSNILGGETWALFYSASENKVLALEAVGPAPTGATAEFYAKPDLPPYGVHQADIPAAFDGWTLALSQYGTMRLGDVLRPAIELAENGFPVGNEFVRESTSSRNEIAKYPSSAQVFFKDGRNYNVGEILIQKDLAETYKRLVKVEEENLSKGRSQAIMDARDYFYRGPLMQALVKFSRENGGLFTEDDFSKVQARVVDPLRISYRRIDVYQCPPNSQGITMLIALNILEGFDLKTMGPRNPETIHLLTEATKLGLADRHWYVGDPDFVSVPVEKLLSKHYAQAQMRKVDRQRAREWPMSGGLGVSGTDTTTVLVRDRFGNAISVTTSIGSNWIVMGDTGIVINDRMPMFDTEPGLPNQVQPGKKVRHTACPAMALKDGRLYMLWACSGVDTQTQAMVQGFINVVDFGLDPFAAVSAPRYITHAFPATRSKKVTNILGLEKALLLPDVVEALKNKGHEIGDRAIFGNMSMILSDAQTGGLLAGVDPRRESHGIGW